MGFGTICDCKLNRASWNKATEVSSCCVHYFLGFLGRGRKEHHSKKQTFCFLSSSFPLLPIQVVPCKIHVLYYFLGLLYLPCSISREFARISTQRLKHVKLQTSCVLDHLSIVSWCLPWTSFYSYTSSMFFCLFCFVSRGGGGVRNMHT